MERLTERIKRLQKDDLIVYTNGKYEDTIPAEMTNDDIRAVLKKLADYEDLEEQGLLVRLPVATGTNVYVVGSFLDCIYDYDNCKANKYVHQANEGKPTIGTLARQLYNECQIKLCEHEVEILRKYSLFEEGDPYD